MWLMNTKNKKLIALVTGANRGMGLATSEKLASLGYHVIMVGRNTTELKQECERLIQKNYSVEFFVADVANENNTNALIQHVIKTFGHVDVLINNAGVYKEEGSIFNATSEEMKSTFETNTMGPYHLMKGIVPLMKKNGFGRVVNVSSGLGAFDSASSNCPAYCVSKVSLNMLTKLFAQETSGTNVKINSVCPGWVRTKMGGSAAPRSIEQGISGIVWAATLNDEGPSGGFFRDGEALDW